MSTSSSTTHLAPAVIRCGVRHQHLHRAAAGRLLLPQLLLHPWEPREAGVHEKTTELPGASTIQTGLALSSPCALR